MPRPALRAIMLAADAPASSQDGIPNQPKISIGLNTRCATLLTVSDLSGVMTSPDAWSAPPVSPWTPHTVIVRSWTRM